MNDINWPRVSVVMITKGRHALAEAAVDSILAADYPAGKREIIVVEEIHKPSAIGGDGVRYVALPVRNLGFPFARNRGISLASAEIIVFVDDDCLVERDWLKELIRPLAESADTAAVAGAVFVSGCGAIGKCENILGFPGGGIKYFHQAQGKIIHWHTFSTCNCALRKKTIEMAGGFYERLKTGGEDSFLSEKISKIGLILYNPHARVYHKARDSFPEVMRWFIPRGRARVELVRNTENKCSRIAPLVVNSILLRTAAAIIICAVIGWPVLPVLGILVLLYYTSVLWRCRWARLYYPSHKTFLLVPVVKAVMDIGMDLGILSAVMQPGEKKA